MLSMVLKSSSEQVHPFGLLEYGTTPGLSEIAHRQNKKNRCVFSGALMGASLQHPLHSLRLTWKLRRAVL